VCVCVCAFFITSVQYVFKAGISAFSFDGCEFSC